MGSVARHVCTEPDAVAALDRHIQQLPNGARVELRLADGERIRGVVGARPVAQVFAGPDGHEGLNAVLRLEIPGADPFLAAGCRDLWVDRIVEVHRLD